LRTNYYLAKTSAPCSAVSLR